MKTAAPNPIRKKLSNYKSVGFRPGEHLRAELEKLSEELSSPVSNFTISDILREGVSAFWTHIRAYMRAKAGNEVIPADVVDRIVAAGIRAHQLGLDPNEIDQALGRALDQKSR
jgi:hypothetical protein